MEYNLAKIEDLEKCPCNSGLKFVECCKNKIINSKKNSIAQFKNDRHLTDFMRKNYTKSNIITCLHPDHKNCVDKIINSHALQNNKILSQLAVNNHVMVISYKAIKEKKIEKIKLTKEYIDDLLLNSCDSFKKEFKEQYNQVKDEISKYYGCTIEQEIEKSVLKYDIEKKGKNEATVFTGFCKYHDSSVFSPIEDTIYTGSEKQHFLFAYRAFAQEYHAKLRAVKEYGKIFKENPALYNDISFVLEYRYRQINQEYMDYVKNLFDNDIMNNIYNNFESIEIKLDRAYDFAVTAMIAPEIDLEGNILNDKYLLDKNTCKSIYLTVFPNDNENIILFSWLKEDSRYFRSYKEQILKLSDDKLKCYLNNLIPAHTPNVVLSPRLWNKQSEKAKEEFLKSFEKENTEITLSQADPKMLSKKRKKILETYNNYLNKTEYDLFK